MSRGSLVWNIHRRLCVTVQISYQSRDEPATSYRHTRESGYPRWCGAFIPSGLNIYDFAVAVAR